MCFRAMVRGLSASLMLASAACGADKSDNADTLWAITGSLAEVRYGYSATLLADGRVLVAGGEGEPASRSAEVYDPITGTWTATGSLIEGRSSHSATLLPDGTVLVAGGVTGFGGQRSWLMTAELYDPVAGTWSRTADLAGPRSDHTATALSDGTVLVVGGASGPIARASLWGLASAEVYDPEAGSWTSTGFMLEQRRFGHTATLLTDGTVLVVGGGDLLREALAEVYDPMQGSWAATADMVVPRHLGHSATLLPDGRVLVAGGGVVENTGTAELFDASDGTWTASTDMLGDRGGHSATLLPDGRVLVAGGRSVFQYESSELYDPDCETWTSAGDMLEVLGGHTAILLATGDVLAIDSAQDIAELYDPSHVARGGCS